MRAGDHARAESIRQRASLLLEQLLIERDRLEAAMCEHGRPDPFKTVTGNSSLDAAIASTRRMIVQLDAAAAPGAAARERARIPAIVTRVAPSKPVAVGV